MPLEEVEQVESVLHVAVHCQLQSGDGLIGYAARDERLVGRRLAQPIGDTLHCIG